MEENKAEYDAKILEYAQLLDLRAARIKKLERQLKDIAYGTRQVKIMQTSHEEEGIVSGGEGVVGQKRRNSYSFVGAPSAQFMDHQLIANLERGQNIFEIHLTKLVLSEEAMCLMKNEKDPSTFCTIEFFEHELQTTPILKGQRAEYNFTSQYVVRIDDFFLHYLQKEKSTIELHQAVGSDYETKAACQLSFRELIDKQTSRIHGHARLMCVLGEHVGVDFGQLEYWARLIVPVDEAFRLYKERTKALGYIATNTRGVENFEETRMKDKRPVDSDMNELNINLLRCTKVNSLLNDKQPSVYCVYKFFDFNDHDTEIISSSNYPEFNDHKSFAVQQNIDLDKYLKTATLDVYVFDDNDSVEDPQYLGLAKIPLIALAHDKDIKGTFELLKADGTRNGTIDITLYWQYSYLPPSASTFSSSGSKLPTSSKKKNETDVPTAQNVPMVPPKSNSPDQFEPKSHQGKKVTFEFSRDRTKFSQKYPPIPFFFDFYLIIFFFI